jgi:hypothetical protein
MCFSIGCVVPTVLEEQDYEDVAHRMQSRWHVAVGAHTRFIGDVGVKGS